MTQYNLWVKPASLSQKVAPGVVRIAVPIPFPMQYVNAFLLLPKVGSAAGPVLVDCGLDTSSAKEALVAGLLENGLRISDLEQVVITHHHPDHYGLAGWLEAQGPQVWMLDHERDSGHAWWQNPHDWALPQQRQFAQHGLPPELIPGLLDLVKGTRTRIHPPQKPQAFSEGQTLQLAGFSYLVLWTPGHADGHAVLLREDGWLIAGDLILERITPNIGLWAYGRPNPLADYLESLKKLEPFAPNQALIGHYGPVLQNPMGRANQLALHHQERLEAMLGFMDVPHTAWEASFKLFPAQLEPQQRRFAWAETLAHLEYLAQQGLLSKTTGQVVHYHR